MNAPSVDIAAMLVADTTLGLTIGSNLFVGRMPTTPQDVVVIRDSYGYPPAVTLGGKSEGSTYYYPSVQILIRDRDYRTGMELGQNIVTSLHGRAQETWNGALYSVIVCKNGPTHMMWDDNGLAHFTINFDLQRR
jgi:hypothetical protein